jgi:hypothetical protein
MAVSPEDLAAGALALQVFVKNAKYVEIIVGVAFAAIPSILGLGAAGLLGSGIINTAKEVRNSISLLKTVGPGLLHGTAIAGKGVNKGRVLAGEWLQQRNLTPVRWVGTFLTLDQLIKSKWTKRKKNNQDTQGKQDKQDEQGGGSGGNPPVPPDTKSEKKEQNNEAEKPKPIEPSYGFSDSLLGQIFKRKGKQG